MKLEEANHGAKVAYVGCVPFGRPFLGNMEWGTVASHSREFVFVKFDQDVAKLGWDGATSKACRPEDLLLYEEEPSGVGR